jgi:Dyp-type peroxidase family
MPPSEIVPEWGDMQGPVLTAYPHLDRATYLLFRITNDHHAQDWLRRLLPALTPALKNIRRQIPRAMGASAAGPSVQDEEKAPCVNVALTYSGLLALIRAKGWTPSGFAAPFVERIDGSCHRQRILGDTGGSVPTGWRWGGSHQPIDILLMVFAKDDAALNATVARYAPHPGLELRAQVPAVSFTAMDGHEHFGFVDGVSQPILTGSHDAERFPESRHLTALGEIVLGYPNADGITPVVPSITPSDDFGKNGTYLVARQLEQHVREFWKFFLRKTGGDDVAAEQLAAKAIGRQRDGTPLVPYTSREDNEFGFAEDQHGYGCPMGAHIRRANPRDTFDNNNVLRASAIASNRHRILRRGRAYGSTHADDPQNALERGLMFLCLNGDPERQFEFIQQDWINNSGFAGLLDERDPLVGDHQREKTFTVQGLPSPARVSGFSRFVTVRGGEYFFLPGLRALTRLVDGHVMGSRYA